MRLEEWYKHVESFEHTDNNRRRAEAEKQEEQRQPPQQLRDRQQPAQPEVRDQAPPSRYPSTAMPAAEPTIVSTPDSERLKSVSHRYAPAAGTAQPVFRTAAPPVKESSARPHAAGRPRTAGVPNRPLRPRVKTEAPIQKESREQLLARLLDPILTLEEAAQVLNVCPTTVRRYTNRGVLQHYRTQGNQRRFRLSHVLNFLGENGGSLQAGTLDQTAAVVAASGSAIRPAARS